MEGLCHMSTDEAMSFADVVITSVKEHSPLPRTAVTCRFLIWRSGLNSSALSVGEGKEAVSGVLDCVDK